MSGLIQAAMQQNTNFYSCTLFAKSSCLYPKMTRNNENTKLIKPQKQCQIKVQEYIAGN